MSETIEVQEEQSIILPYSKAGREPHEVRIAKLALPPLRKRNTKMRNTLASLDAKKDRARIGVLLRESLKLKNRMQYAEVVGLRYHVDVLKTSIAEYEPLIGNDTAYEAALDILREDLYESVDKLSKLEETTTECDIGEYDE